MTGNGYTWRPSMLEPSVSHLTRNGDETHLTPERWGDAPWMFAGCGQNTSANKDEAWWMARCPECLAWLQRQQQGR